MREDEVVSVARRKNQGKKMQQKEKSCHRQQRATWKLCHLHCRSLTCHRLAFFFFYLCLSPQPLVLTPHSAHKAKKKKYSGGENLSFDHCITRRSPYTSVRTLLLSSLARICAAHFLTGAVGFPDSLGHVTVLARHRLRRL